MLKSVLYLSLLATPLLATKRYNALSLDIFIKKAELPNDKDLKAIKCTTAYPVGAEPVALEVPTSFNGSTGTNFGKGVNISTWADVVEGFQLTTVPLRADEGIRNFHVEGLGMGKDLNVSHDFVIPDRL
jgi:hypothetical protein